MGSKISKLLFIGDIVGDAGYEALQLYLQRVIDKYKVCFVVVNAENRSMPYHSGLKSKDAYEILKLGVDVITLGNHVVYTPCIRQAIENNAPIIRPMNIPNIAGSGSIVVQKNGLKFLIINAICNFNMDVAYNNVFSTLENFFSNIDTSEYNCIFMDLHGYSQVEKSTILQYFSGKLTAIVGTHTHTPTNDCRIVGGTGFQSDAGMTGVFDTIKGKEYDWRIINKFRYWCGFTDDQIDKRPKTYRPKSRTMCGTLVYFDVSNAKTTTIKPIIYGDTLFGAIK